VSNSEVITIACPACTKKQQFTVWVSVNATLSPELKQKLLDRTLFTFKCEKCGETAEVNQELMYHDMERKLMFLRGQEAPQETLDECFGPDGKEILADYTYRLVNSMNELIEKIVIWDAGLDDRAIEVFKFLLLKDLDEEERGVNPQLFYNGLSAEAGAEAEMEFVLINDSGTLSVSVPFEETYQQYEIDIKKGLPSPESEHGKWLRVDQEYAAAHFE
jgi:hypothetical protein